jgi:lipopolysaccharide/colanic/teichoic acid biosynthesis glycosyltransferase
VTSPVEEGWARRAVDLLGAVVALAVLSPLFAGVAAAIVIESGRPVFYSQVRVGKARRPFRILKFRTMVANADRIGPKVSGHKDARVTRVGAFLRATKIDEFPQFVNVLRGEMTLIGPRAEVPDMVRHYHPEELAILDYRPGLTAPGQIYFTTDQAGQLDSVQDAESHYVEHQLHPKLRMDLDYLRDRSVRNDLGILWKTVKLLLGAGAERRKDLV